MKQVIITLIFFTTISIKAQVCFTYDNAGNRIKRQSPCFSAITSDERDIFVQDYSLLESRILNQYRDLSEMIVYPNPSSGVFRLIDQGEYLGEKLYVISMEGKMIESLVLTNVDIDLMHLPSGQYYVILSTGYSRRAAKLFITK